ncbi:hypothetical protein CCZ01_09185 [Helicobacter monodelphidis]|uniref:hypothetical protein n=1 Tax=Helicobacter sp. 15-1451 TaxID=2004995 RepID=UPI000DCDC9B1|nr:hypothetical protein [Helicobacter sp. 15-1451]RAX56537.1 hypothetical protein CCZ01_09185 [Helicobacter sp. 15-1451]
MATMCPKCRTGKVGKRNGMVACENYKVSNKNKKIVSVGKCSFHIFYAQNFWESNRVLSDEEMRQLIAGEVLENSIGETLQLDLKQEHCVFVKKEAKEYEDL